jgi:hypothetical protein
VRWLGERFGVPGELIRQPAPSEPAPEPAPEPTAGRAAAAPASAQSDAPAQTDAGLPGAALAQALAGLDG